ncbi:zinc-ribbon domain-containing protein [Methanobrevibacter sp.]
MATFCPNCGTELRKDYKFCTNCGTKIITEDAFCTNCGTKLRKDYKFCTNCGTEIHKTNIKQDQDPLKPLRKLIEKEMAAREEAKKKSKTDNKTNESEKIRSTPKKEKTRIRKEVSNEKTEKPKMTNGGYCNLSCRHCYEEFFDGGGGIVGDFDGEGYVEYYCRLGHSAAFGSFCKYYE